MIGREYSDHAHKRHEYSFKSGKHLYLYHDDIVKHVQFFTEISFNL